MPLAGSRRPLGPPRRPPAAGRRTATPPWYFSARTVATTTAASGRSPESRHLRSKNFSAPRSDPKPASVTTTSLSASAVRVASTELQPCAMLANGPPCTKAGACSRVCTRLGGERVRSSTASAPSAPRGRAAVTGFLVAGVGDDDAADPLLEVRQRLGQAEDRHQLAGHDDVEAVLAREAVGGAAEPDHDLAQRPVVDVDHPLPGDRRGRRCRARCRGGRGCRSARPAGCWRRRSRRSRR